MTAQSQKLIFLVLVERELLTCICLCSVIIDVYMCRWQHCVLQDDRWGCTDCGKQFLGADFLMKHLRSRHGLGETDNLLEEQYFNNFARDPSRALPLAPTADRRHAPGRESGYQMELQQPAMSFYPYPAMTHGYAMPAYPAMGYASAGHGMMSTRDPIPRTGYRTTVTANYPAPAANQRRDPRAIVSYVDLDKPPTGEDPLNYG